MIYLWLKLKFEKDLKKKKKKKKEWMNNGLLEQHIRLSAQKKKKKNTISDERWLNANWEKCLENRLFKVLGSNQHLILNKYKKWNKFVKPLLKNYSLKFKYFSKILHELKNDNIVNPLSKWDM